MPVSRTDGVASGGSSIGNKKATQSFQSAEEVELHCRSIAKKAKAAAIDLRAGRKVNASAI